MGSTVQVFDIWVFAVSQQQFGSFMIRYQSLLK